MDRSIRDVLGDVAQIASHSNHGDIEAKVEDVQHSSHATVVSGTFWQEEFRESLSEEKDCRIALEKSIAECRLEVQTVLKSLDEERAKSKASAARVVELEMILKRRGDCFMRTLIDDIDFEILRKKGRLGPLGLKTRG